MKTKGDELQQKREKLEAFLNDLQNVCAKHNMSLTAEDYTIAVDDNTDGNNWEHIGGLICVDPHNDVDTLIDYVHDEREDFLINP